MIQYIGDFSSVTKIQLHKTLETVRIRLSVDSFHRPIAGCPSDPFLVCDYVFPVQLCVFSCNYSLSTIYYVVRFSRLRRDLPRAFYQPPYQRLLLLFFIHKI